MFDLVGCFVDGTRGQTNGKSNRQGNTEGSEYTECAGVVQIAQMAFFVKLRDRESLKSSPYL
eukprot:4253813-Pyramimonas_sp.AAC.1